MDLPRLGDEIFINMESHWGGFVKAVTCEQARNFLGNLSCAQQQVAMFLIKASPAPIALAGLVELDWSGDGFFCSATGLPSETSGTYQVAALTLSPTPIDKN